MIKPCAFVFGVVARYAPSLGVPGSCSLCACAFINARARPLQGSVSVSQWQELCVAIAPPVSTPSRLLPSCLPGPSPPFASPLRLSLPAASPPCRCVVGAGRACAAPLPSIAWGCGVMAARSMLALRAARFPACVAPTALLCIIELLLQLAQLGWLCLGVLFASVRHSHLHRVHSPPSPPPPLPPQTFLSKSEVTDRVLAVVKSFEKVDPAKVCCHPTVCVRVCV